MHSPNPDSVLGHTAMGTNPARIAARAVARDLLRFVRALEARGVDLRGLAAEERAALDACHRAVARALAAEAPDGEAVAGARGTSATARSASSTRTRSSAS